MFFAEMYFIIDHPLCYSHRAELAKTFENKSKLLAKMVALDRKLGNGETSRTKPWTTYKFKLVG